jgi:hypothetical protein
MLKRIPMLALFVLLGGALALLPVACSSDNNGGNDASSDTAPANPMTGA